MKNKSDVCIIFPQFKVIVEMFFNLLIITLYSDNGVNILYLKNFSQQMAYLITPHHHIHLDIMHQLKDTIDILSKLVVPYFVMPNYHLHFGHLPSE